jgi:hypothetical protein
MPTIETLKEMAYSGNGKVNLDLANTRFGMLTAIRPVIRFGKQIKWYCKCDCGADALVVRSNLTSGHTKSCGCLGQLRPVEYQINYIKHHKETKKDNRQERINRCFQELRDVAVSGGSKIKTIPLTKNSFTIVDDDDYERLNKHKWFCTDKGYAARIFRSKGEQHTQYMSRVIMGEPIGVEVDHINRNPLDNRKCNLRVVTRQQNAINSSTNTHTSQYRGVHWCWNDRKWRSGIKVNGKNIHIGYFKSETEAATEYNRKAIELHGDFARLNTIKPPESEGAK